MKFGKWSTIEFGANMRYLFRRNAKIGLFAKTEIQIFHFRGTYEDSNLEGNEFYSENSTAPGLELSIGMIGFSEFAGVFIEIGYGKAFGAYDRNQDLYRLGIGFLREIPHKKRNVNRKE
ncbi:MAG: hypothetical protein JSU85_10415 [Candidatus Zixiibacteriota bacterium]|nr:MAG: hypothetical protein JSU85_10415 [candidate division Zixibacteria bacterium]